MRRYLGIDPGQKGGLALLRHGRIESCVRLERMPTSPHDLHLVLYSLITDWEGTVAVVEKAQPMPKQGVTSCFNYGVGYGVIIGLLTALEIPYHEVRSQVWKKVVLAGVKSRSDKAESIRICRKLFPTVNLTPAGCRNPQDGLAEALLLAEYGRRLNL